MKRLKTLSGSSFSNGSSLYHENREDIAVSESRIILFDDVHPCSSLLFSRNNIVLDRLNRRIEPLRPNERKYEALKITIPFRDIEHCHLGQLGTGSIFVLKVRCDSYLSFRAAFNQPEIVPESSPDNFIQIITKKSIKTHDMRYIESSMKAERVMVNLLHGSTKFFPEQVIKGQVPIEHVLSAIPDAIHIDDECNDYEQSEDFDNKELINFEDGRVIFKDYLTLKPRMYVNDSILDYHLSYIQKNFRTFHPNLHMAIIPAFKATVMITKSLKGNHIPGSMEKLVHSKNISKCDYLVLPIVGEQHWFMAVIGNINKTFKYFTSISTQTFSPGDIPKRDLPYVIYFDSFHSYFGPKNRQKFDQMIFAFIRDCLLVHLQLQNPSTSIPSYRPSTTDMLADFTQDLVSFHRPILPQQTNNYDCGLFLLEYAEKFFENPVKLSVLIIKNNEALVQWFSPTRRNVTRKYLIDKITDELAPDDYSALQDYLKKSNRLSRL